MTLQEVLKHFNLQPHPEGGYFQETYRSKDSFGDRSCSTAIYYLLPKGAHSRFHRIKSDEIWHFYLGGPLRIAELGREGSLKETLLGANVTKGQVLQYCVPAGVWFGARPAQGTEYALVGCTVSPGFDYADFEIATEKDLAPWPGAEAWFLE